MSIFIKKLENVISIGLDKLTDEINTTLRKGGAKESELVHTNQVKCAFEVLKSFDNDRYPRSNHIIVKGKTQSGKTGVFQAIIGILKLYPELFKVLNITTIYYITGDNSCKLKSQSMERIACLFDSEFGCKFICLKNSDLKKDTKTINITNSIVFIDECHFGIEKDSNKVIEWLKRKGLDMHNTDNLTEKSVYIISNSATPYSEINSDVAATKQVVKLMTDDWDGKKGYVGIPEFASIGAFEEDITRNDVRGALKPIREHLDYIKEKTGRMKCAIVRVTKKTYYKYKKEFDELFKVFEFFQNGDSINYEGMESVIEHDCEQYNKPVLIVIAGAYRLGATIKHGKDNIAAIYDVASVNKSKPRYGIVTTEQGLLGRLSGYRDNDSWKDLRIWVHKDAISPLKAYYVEQAVSSPSDTYRKQFMPGNGNIIGIAEQSATMTYSNVPSFNKGNLKSEIKEYLEAQDEKFKSMLSVPGRRYTVKGHQTKAYFSKDAEELCVESNVGKSCYTFLYNEEAKTIEVLFGEITFGVYCDVKTPDVIATLETFGKKTFQPDVNGNTIGLKLLPDLAMKTYTDVPVFNNTYRNDVREFLRNADPDIFGIDPNTNRPRTEMIACRQNKTGNSTHFSEPVFSYKAVTDHGYPKMLSEERLGDTVYYALYDYDERTIKVKFGKVSRGFFVYKGVEQEPVKTLETYKI